MITKYVSGLATKMGIKLSCLTVYDNAPFSNSNRKSLKIASGGNLVMVPFQSEELMDGDISEKLKKRIYIVLSGLSGHNRTESD
jgi:hypothetical protein